MDFIGRFALQIALCLTVVCSAQELLPNPGAIPEPFLTPCAVVRCAADTRCRVVIPRPCNGCKPEARCVPVDQLGPGTDGFCTRNRYPEAILQERPGNSGQTFYSPYRCQTEPGAQRCPDGSDCVRSYRGQGVCCLGPQQPVVEPFPVDPINIESACAATTCLVGTICRVIIESTNGQPKVACLPNDSVGEGIDLECRRQDFRTAILQEQRDQSGNPISYNLIKCRGPLFTQKCPSTSTCVDDLRGGGTCCFSKLEAKPGVCPVPGPISICGGIVCDNDQDCPGSDKCCDIGCGGKLCTRIIDQPVDRCGGCPKGQTCVDRPAPCPPGRLCILALLPTCVRNECVECRPGQDCIKDRSEKYACEPLCGRNKPCKPGDKCVTNTNVPGGVECVPEIDPCGGCAKGEVCVDTQIRCVTTPCPDPYVCVPNNECGGCRPGQVCIDTGIRCITTPCPSFQCVEDNQCGGCPPGKKCELLPTPCAPPPVCLDDADCPPYECKPLPVCVDVVTPPPGSVCPLRCPPNFFCTFIQTDCLPGADCEPSPVPTCVPLNPLPESQNQESFAVRDTEPTFTTDFPPTTTEFPPLPRIKLGSCPRPYTRYSLNSNICRYEIQFLRPTTCEVDENCPGREKCCISKCGRKVCLYPYLT